MSGLGTIGTLIAASTATTQEIPPPQPVNVAGLEEPSLEGEIIDAEAAIVRNDIAGAAAILERLVAMPEHPVSARARELLGVVRERSEQTEAARVIYRDYLARYPGGDGFVRVTQRLASLSASTPPPLTAAQPSDANAWSLDLSGIVSQFYLRDRSRSELIDTRPPPIGDGIDRRNNVEEVLSIADVRATAARGSLRIEARAAAGHVEEIRPVVLVGSDRGEGSYDTLSALYLEIAEDRLGVTGRIGRQSRFGAGVFGRFDGALVNWQVSPRLRLEVIAGHPVRTSRQTRVDTGRSFHAVSAEYAWSDRATTSIYWFDQRARGFIDRQAIGIEGRFTRATFNAYALIDYDVHFGKLNAALLQVNYVMSGGSAVSLTAQRLHYPTLALTNAVAAQPVPTLEAMRQTFTDDQIRQAARDRTLVSDSVSVTYTRPLTTRWHLIADATIATTTGEPASFGVPAVPASGAEFYAGLQAIGTGVVAKGDTWLAGLRYAETRLARAVAADVTVRLPLSDRFRIAPRLRIGWRDQARGTGSLTIVQPSIRATFQATRTVELEAEVGGNIIRQHYTGPVLFGRRRETAFVAQLGYQLRF